MLCLLLREEAQDRESLFYKSQSNVQILCTLSDLESMQGWEQHGGRDWLMTNLRVLSSSTAIIVPDWGHTVYVNHMDMEEINMRLKSGSW